MNIYKNFTDYQTVKYTIAGNELGIGTVENLKIYAGNTVYINKKKTVISEQDIETIKRANREMFITTCLNHSKDGRTVYYERGYYRVNLKDFTGLVEEKNDEVDSVLQSLGFTVVSL